MLCPDKRNYFITDQISMTACLYLSFLLGLCGGGVAREDLLLIQDNTVDTAQLSPLNF